MENLYFGKERLAKGIYAAALPPTRTLAQVAVADIGAVAAVRLAPVAIPFVSLPLTLAMRVGVARKGNCNACSSNLFDNRS